MEPERGDALPRTVDTEARAADVERDVESTMNEVPVRLCCMERHWGVRCPDGKVMCCLCFDRFDVGELSRTPEGDPVDVCIACASSERGPLPVDAEARE